MPNTPSRSDWDRHFGANRERRRGPVGLFIVMTLVLSFVAVLAVGLRFGAGQYREYQVAQGLTATPLWAQYYQEQTATALARTEPTLQATEEQSASVVASGNLRSEPRIVPETIIGEVAVGDALKVLETRNVEDRMWYRVRVPSGTEGWVSSTLVGPPTP